LSFLFKEKSSLKYGNVNESTNEIHTCEKEFLYGSSDELAPLGTETVPETTTNF
jgi:hypothetical protein